MPNDLKQDQMSDQEFVRIVTRQVWNSADAESKSKDETLVQLKAMLEKAKQGEKAAT
ncbi:hypothetical protein [Deinococcus sp.]|uniref:hypothetical protein n=1 Tax=Deinococcus sp. TaxID=47478 RepID=UPI003B5A2F53